MLRYRPRVKPLPSEVQIANCAAPNLWRRRVYGAWFWTNPFDGVSRDHSNNTGDFTIAAGTPVFENTPFGICPSYSAADWDLIASSANRGPVGTVILIIGMKTTGVQQQMFSHDSSANDGFRLQLDSSNTWSYTLGGVADYTSSITLSSDANNPPFYALSTRVDSDGGTVRFRSTNLLDMTTSTDSLSIGTMSGTPSQVTLRDIDAFSFPFRGINVAAMWFGDELEDLEIAQIERDPFAMIRPARMPGDLVYDSVAAAPTGPVPLRLMIASYG